MHSPGPLFIIGAGPLISSYTARLFATHSFTHIALFSRTTDSLSSSASFIKSAAPGAIIKTHAVDVTDKSGLTNALSTAVNEVGAPEVVIYNAARIRFGALGEYPQADIVEDFKIPCLGLVTTANVLLPHLQAVARQSKEAHPALFVTSGFIVHQPQASVFSLGMAKAAQANLVKLLTEENRGVVHVALVTVGGVVGTDEGVIHPADVADKFGELWKQRKEEGKWEEEVKVG